MPSLRHRLLVEVMAHVRKSSEVVDAEAVRDEKLAINADAQTSPPSRLASRCDISTLDGFGFPVYALEVGEPRSGRTFLYLHGGGYNSPAHSAHWKFVARLAEALDVRVVFPAYPLAPEFTWRDSHPQLISLFERLAVESPRGVVLAGDSAGGGFALALAQQLATRPGPQPVAAVLISPWVDVTCATPGSAKAGAADPWLKMSRLLLAGRWWAGDDDPTRPEVSPLYGDLSGLPRTLMLCGTRDTLYPQCRDLAARAESADWELTYVEEPGLLHVYPVLPVPEAKRAFTLIVAFLSERIPWAGDPERRAGQGP